ncbi:SufB/SufD family protein [Oribacterium sp. P6A1]|uniref:SufB/SufD family protein n=1 Tax=Oribacterium sp. P6A1 TaxID=1410612 RepID=UPI000568075A|nr:SufD family Fe-S cluster assembly protein [Oribacterium sp. P6A1]
MENNTLLINAMPAPTYNWLKMNDAPVKVPAELTEGNPFVTRSSEVSVSAAAYDEIMDIPGGMGYDMDSLVQKSGADVLKISLGNGQKVSSPVKIDFNYTCDANSVNAVYIDAAPDSDVTVIMDFSSEKEANGFAALQTKVRIGKNAKVLLVQIQRLGNGFRFFNDIASRADDNGSFEEMQLVLSGKETYKGSRTDLSGKGSSLKTDIAYLLKNRDHLDMNYIANHIGKKSVCDIKVNGVLRGEAFKLFRGTIDLRKGAKGAVGNELEDVLLMDDEVINQTIPVILCDEDDVEGNHGATIGSLNEDLLFYMESRGMNREEVYEMMAKARIDSVVSKIPDEETKSLISKYLEENR